LDIGILFPDEEVYNAVHQCCVDKARGAHGMTMAFIKDDRLKADILRMLTEFDFKGKFVKGLNVTFTSLIPKKPLVQHIGGYRSLRLVGCI